MRETEYDTGRAWAQRTSVSAGACPASVSALLFPRISLTVQPGSVTDTARPEIANNSATSLVQGDVASPSFMLLIGAVAL